MFSVKRVIMSLLLISFFAVLASNVYAATYTVHSGDTLYKIGKLLKIKVDVIKESNKLKNSIIYKGQKLNIPSWTYKVKIGDTLYLIAKKYKLTVSALKKVNKNLSDTIQPGQKINIPGSKPVKSPSISNSTSTSIISYSKSELDLLARLITAEANGEPYKAEVGVGAVVVNRVKDKSFPNTIKDVIYEIDNGYYQFTPVENGWINKPATQDAKNAAYDAIHGSDPTNGALYYYDVKTTSTWLLSKKVAIKIDKMVFSY